MWKKIRAIVLVVTGVAAGWLWGAWHTGWSVLGSRGSTHTGVSIEQVQALSSLVTTKVSVADVVETHINGWTGGVKAGVLVKGDFLLGVDLSRAKFENVDPQARTAVLVLPQPQVDSPRVDHERTKVFAISETGLWQITPTGGKPAAAVVNLAFRDAQRYIGEAAGDSSLLPRARQQAETVLGAFFRAMGWVVEIRWDGS